jgi:hypothetical protein
MKYTKAEGSSNLLGEFTDKAVTSKKALAKFARKKGPPKGKPTKRRKAS